MKIRLKRTNDKLAFRAVNEEGRHADIDAAAGAGGEGLGMRPMELLLSSLASCASIDVLLILEKQKVKLASYEVSAEAVRSNDVPAVFESIHLVFATGTADPAEKVLKAVRLSIEKYCSVAAMLYPGCRLTYEVTQPEGPNEK